MDIRELFLNGLVSYILTGGKNATVSGAALIVAYVLGFAVVIVVPYLLGSINFGIIISGRLYGDDVRKHGSGGSGMTNMMRSYGMKPAALTLAGDALKAVVAVLLGRLILGDLPFAGGYIAALMCCVGHAYPIFFGFKGGKGVAVTAGAILALNPAVFAVLLVMFVIVVAGTKYLSLGSLTAVVLWPLVLKGYNVIYGIENLTLAPVFCILTAVFVVFLHRENISRLYHGKENKFSFKKSVKKADGDAPDKSADKKGGKGASGKGSADGKNDNTADSDVKNNDTVSDNNSKSGNAADSASGKDSKSSDSNANGGEDASDNNSKSCNAADSYANGGEDASDNNSKGGNAADSNANGGEDASGNNSKGGNAAAGEK